MNKYLIVSMTTLIICQLIKFTIESIKNKKLCFQRLLNGSGGMPSSHTSLMVSLTNYIYLVEGNESPLFALSFVISLIVIYDSFNVRLETEKQSKVINRLVKLDKKYNYRKLKEDIGHEPIEVIGGVILGLFTSIIFHYSIF